MFACAAGSWRSKARISKSACSATEPPRRYACRVQNGHQRDHHIRACKCFAEPGAIAYSDFVAAVRQPFLQQGTSSGKAITTKQNPHVVLPNRWFPRMTVVEAAREFAEFALADAEIAPLMSLVV